MGETGRERSRCMDCGMWLDDAGEYHPHLYCTLYKAGVRDPEEYLRRSGWVRADAE